MNIIMATNNYQPHIGGVARSVASFTRHYRNRGHRVLVIAPQLDGQLSEPDLIAVPAFHLTKTHDLAAPLPVPSFVAAAIREFQPDIIHAHHPFLLGDTALSAAVRWNIPIVFTHHTMHEHYTHYAATNSPLLQKFIVDLSTGYANLCTCVFAPTPSIAAILKQRGVTTRIEIVPTGIDTKHFAKNDGQDIRRQMNIPLSAFVVGHVGRLAEEKNLIFFIKALIQFLSTNIQAHAVIVGDGPLRSNLENMISESGLCSRVHFTGALQNDKLIAAYHTMNVFGFSSISETQGLVVLEALAAGVPVVALDAPGPRDLIQPGYNGWLVLEHRIEAFAQVLHTISRLPQPQREELRQQAQHSTRQYDESICADRALGIYRSLIESGQQLNFKEHHVASSPWAATQRLLTAEWELWANRLSAIYTALRSEKHDMPTIAAVSTDAGKNTKNVTIISLVQLTFTMIVLTEIFVLRSEGNVDHIAVWSDLIATNALMFSALALLWRLRQPTFSRNLVPAILGMISLTIADALGSTGGWYDHWYWYDEVVHTLGGIAGTVYFYQLFRLIALHRHLAMPLSVHGYIAFTTTVLVGTLFEIFEVTVDIAAHRTWWLNARVDTNRDLAFNIIGACIAMIALIAIFHIRRQHTKNDHAGHS